jgi:L-threonylcarbamoyladenylate synthase
MQIRSADDPEAIRAAAEIIRRGDLVAFPTETVYGLGANALDAGAVAKIFAAKGRPSFNPLIVHVGSVAQARELTTEWTAAAAKVAAAFWPGPLTIVLPKKPHVPDIVSAGLATVALRLPSHPVARLLLEQAGVPIAAPSANRSTELSPTRAEHVAKSLGDRVELILDGGLTEVGLESTVVDLTGETAVILRPGRVSLEELNAVVATVRSGEQPLEGEARSSPGMMERHYAPQARLELFDRDDLERLQRHIDSATERGALVGVVLREELPVRAPRLVRLPDSADSFGRLLYETLHTLDDAGCAMLFVQRPPAGSEWDAVRDRLQRAAR